MRPPTLAASPIQPGTIPALTIPPSPARPSRSRKKFSIFLLLIVSALMSSLTGQVYKIKFLGIPCVDVALAQPTADSIRFSTKTVGIIDLIWPVDNQYTTTYDPVTFTVRQFEKRIRQGAFRQELHFTRDEASHTLVYGKDSVSRPENVQTIFTLLARVSRETAADLDGRWMPMEHEGRPYSLRLLWADSNRIAFQGQSRVCDHYRLDIRPAEGPVLEVVAASDYFSENIVHPDAVRQLWVERGGQRRILKAAVKLFGFTLEARSVHD